MKEQLSRLRKMLDDREISSLELTQEYIKKIEDENSTYNAFVHTCFEEALESAKRADELLETKSGGLLCGIPYGLKDNITTKGITMSCCSRMLADFKPVYDAAVVEKLNLSGAVLLGKTNMDEFAMGSTSESSFFGAPKNPVNTDYVTGGSSGGSAAAVAADLAPFTLGSDTGGSIRQPASFCGIVGFKPSYGVVSRYGLIAYGSSLDQIGPLCRSVKDAAMVFDIIKGADRRDSTSRDLSEESAAASLTGNARGLRIGIAKEYFDSLSDEINGAIMQAAKVYEEAGASLITVSIPALKSSLPVYYIIACAEASSNLGRYDGIRYGYRPEEYQGVDDMVYLSRSEGFGREVKKRIMLGTYVLSSGYYDAYYKKACLIRSNISRSFEEVFEKCDVLIAPTSPVTAFRLGDDSLSSVDMYLSDIATVPVNIAGLPAVSIPVGFDKKGLPIGMQVIGKRFEDNKVLDAAYFYEKQVSGQ